VSHGPLRDITLGAGVGGDDLLGDTGTANPS